MTPDVLIVGAGPAGMAAAIAARGQGLSVLLLDENPAPGGQVFRALDRREAADAQERQGKALLAGFAACGAEVRHGAVLWAVEDGPRVFWSEHGAAQSATPGRLMLATGATERPLPIPGWTLPGVMGVGAAQIALKTSALVPDGQVWMAGQGPLMWLYAVQALKKGGRIAGIIDLAPPGLVGRAMRHLPAVVRGADYIARGLLWQRSVKRAGVPVFSARDVAAEGRDRLEAVRFDGQRRPADLLLLHDGVVPNTQVTRAIQGCRHEWAEGSWRPVLDAWGNTSIPGVMVAGDSGGIGGAVAAALSGTLAALDAARQLGRMTEHQRDALANPTRLARGRHLAIRPLLDALFPPRPFGAVADTTILCRCEEVSAGRVREAVALGCLGANQVKAFCRAGMGACQGRVCGPAVHGAIAAARGVAGDAVEPFRTRFPTKPLTLGELAALHG
ncbi:NAD(P)/FAD-dependent oxidoreductase [Humitalea sp. 24SJ18S-53]|uniref:FAD/NAD(P)-dependent oxidoreductase n=1 Tax=Humitalea sp. 24SJ18S-53 TaxID=3422307 RepID=UPI003D6654F0